MFADAVANGKRSAPGGAEQLEGQAGAISASTAALPVRTWFSIAGRAPPQRSLHMRQLWLLLTDPASSRAAYAASIVSLSAVIIMSTILCLETMPDLRGNVGAQLGLWAVEAVCTAIFSVEYGAKVASAPSRLAYVLSFEAIIDVVTILPFFVGLGICGMQGCDASNGSLKLMLARPPALTHSLPRLLPGPRCPCSMPRVPSPVQLQCSITWVSSCADYCGHQAQL